MREQERTKSPAFRFYPSDFFGSPDVQTMELDEIGAYLSLLSNAWLGDRPGCLPDDDDKLRRWARMSREQWTESRHVLLSKFPVVEPGWRGNSRLLLEYSKQEDYRQSRSENGKKGGRPKKHVVTDQNHEETICLESESIDESIEKPSVSVSVSASVSDTSSPTEKQILSPVPAAQELEICLPPGFVLDEQEDSGFESGSIEAAVPHEQNTKPPASPDTPKAAPTQRKEKHTSVQPYSDAFSRAYDAYPKHVEKSESQSEFTQAVRRLMAGERGNPQINKESAEAFLATAAADYSRRMAAEGREEKMIRSMRRWLRGSNYLDYSPKPRAAYRVVPDEEATATWRRDFGGDE